MAFLPACAGMMRPYPYFESCRLAVLPPAWQSSLRYPRRFCICILRCSSFHASATALPHGSPWIVAPSAKTRLNSQRFRPCGLDVPSHSLVSPLLREILTDTLGISHRPDRAMNRGLLRQQVNTCPTVASDKSFGAKKLSVTPSPLAGNASRMRFPLLRRTASASDAPCSLSVQLIRVFRHRL